MHTCRQIHTSIHIKSQQELLVQAERSQGNLSIPLSLLILYSKHTHTVFIPPLILTPHLLISSAFLTFAVP